MMLRRTIYHGQVRRRGSYSYLYAPWIRMVTVDGGGGGGVYHISIYLPLHALLMYLYMDERRTRE